MLGVPRRKVKLLPHNPEWLKLFKIEEKLLKKFGKVEHVGSTSVPGIYAKPIIDIALGVPSLKNKEIHKYKKPLAKVGYQYIREDRYREFLFVKGDESSRTHYLHLVQIDSNAWKRYIHFRDHLINNTKSRKKYSDLKRKLADKFADDRKSYTANKHKFIGKGDRIGKMIIEE